MDKNSKRLGKVLLGIAAASGIGGCASSFDKVREAVSAAPEWYEQSASEVRGEGYPDIRRIPSLDAGERSTQDLVSGQAAVAAAEALFRMDPRSVPPGLELQAMLDWSSEAVHVANLKASEPGNHITDEDVARLRALFDIARAQS